MASLTNMQNRLGAAATTHYNMTNSKGLDSLHIRLDRNNKPDQWTRMREDKLKSLKRALFYSYQAAVIKFDNDDRDYEFRCLINHDKLKVEYEDKILSIPFVDIPKNSHFPVDVGSLNEDETDKYRVKTGDTFVWLSGNEDYMADSHWMIYLQYSEETAYFRGEIRLCKDIIEIIDEEGNHHKYYAWTTGPNETQIVWNIKKNVTWNDMNYTKILYITRNKDVTSYLQRFNHIQISSGKYEVDDSGNYVLDSNGNKVPLYEWWEIQGVNNTYGDGIIRVAIKEMYSNEAKDAAKSQKQIEEQTAKAAAATSQINGDIVVYPYDIKTYTVTSPIVGGTWTVSNTKIAKIIKQDNTSVTIEIIYPKSYKNGFDIEYNSTDVLHITVKSL